MKNLLKNLFIGLMCYGFITGCSKESYSENGKFPEFKYAKMVTVQNKRHNSSINIEIRSNSEEELEHYDGQFVEFEPVFYDDIKKEADIQNGEGVDFYLTEEPKDITMERSFIITEMNLPENAIGLKVSFRNDQPNGRLIVSSNGFWGHSQYKKITIQKKANYCNHLVTNSYSFSTLCGVNNWNGGGYCPSGPGSCIISGYNNINTGIGANIISISKVYSMTWSISCW